MYKIPENMRRDIERYRPIQFDGLTFYPIEVREYADFLAAAPAIEFMQQSLPVAMLSKPLLESFFEMDMTAIQQGEGGIYLYQTVLFLALALRIGQGQTAEQRASHFLPIVYQDQPNRLKCLRFTLNGEEIWDITPAQFQTLRPILAAQNGLEIPSESANPELVYKEREQAAQANADLDISLEKKISYVATLCRVEEEEIDKWPILKFQKKEQALTHVLRYMLCGTAEAQGASWKGGNPVPHPYFERRNNGLGVLKNIKEMVPQEAQNAVETPGQKTTA